MNYSRQRLSTDSNIDLYQSHVQTYRGSAMPNALKRSSNERRFTLNPDSLAVSLNKSFYTTSYQSDISKSGSFPS